VLLPGDPVGQLAVGLVARDLGDAHAVLLAGADADRRAVLDVEHGVAGDRRFDQPAEDQVGVLLRGGQAPDAVDRAVLAGALGRHELRRGARLGHERPLRHQTAVDQRFEIDHALRHVGGQARHVVDAHDAQVLLGREQLHHARTELRRDHHFGVVLGDQPGRLQIDLAVERDAAAERGQAVGLVGAEIGLGQRAAAGDAARVVVLHDDGARGVVEVAQDVERVVGVGQVGFAGMLARLQQLGIGGQIAARREGRDLAQREVAVHELVEGRLLAGIFTVAQPLLLAVDHPGDLFVTERLAGVAVDEGDLHTRREVVVHDRLVGGFQVNGHVGTFLGFGFLVERSTRLKQGKRIKAQTALRCKGRGFKEEGVRKTPSCPSW